MSVIDYLVGRLKKGIITFIHAVILANWEMPYNDHLKDTTTSTYQVYQVGKNAKLGGTTPRKFFALTLKDLLLAQNP